MSATLFNLQVEQGIPYSQTFVVKDSLGANIDLTGYTARLEAKQSYSSASVLIASTELGNIFLDTLNSYCVVNLTEEDTLKFSDFSTLYDLVLFSPTGIPLKLTRGLILLQKTATSVQG